MWNLMTRRFTNSQYILANQDQVYLGLQHKLLAEPLEALANHTSSWFRDKLLKHVQSCEWFEFFNFVEFLMGFNTQLRNETQKYFNQIAEEEGLGYRAIDGLIQPIIEPEEIEEIDRALKDSSSSGAKLHIRKALQCLRQEDGNVDAKSAIREAIHAVEAQAKEVAGDEKATLPFGTD
jgi:AbiJ N-terminal domain 4